MVEISGIENTDGGREYNWDDLVNWERTRNVQLRLGDSPEFVPAQNIRDVSLHVAPYGTYLGRPVIGSRMSNIIGGIYLGAHAREAIVVDDAGESEGDKNLLNFYQKEFLPKLQKDLHLYCDITQGANANVWVILACIYHAVSKAIPYSSKKTEELLAKHFPAGYKDEKIHISGFIKNKTGICRHQALLVGYLIEKLLIETFPHIRLDGYFSIERNKFIDGAHAWTRFTDAKGEVWIIDVAQKQLGRLKDLKNQAGWIYERREDK